jgi:hypothetical protein
MAAGVGNARPHGPLAGASGAGAPRCSTIACTIRFVAEMPAHVCLNEIVITPTWNRLLIGGGELRLVPPLPE